MNEMIERAARALYAANGKDPDKFLGPWEPYFAQARAVIAEMREPTKAMIEAGHARLADEGTLADLWTAMADSILAEGEPR